LRKVIAVLEEIWHPIIRVDSCVEEA
jgi:hypothetical protein